MAKQDLNHVAVPGWRESLAPSGPLAAIQLQHTTWRNQPDKSRVRRRTHFHDIFHMVSFTGKQGSFIIDDQMHQTEDQVLILCNPGQPHSFSADPTDKHTYNEVTFSVANQVAEDWSALMKLFFNDELRIPAIIPLSAKAHTEFEDLIRHLVRIVHTQPPQASILCGAYIYQILFWFYRLLLDQEQAAMVSDEWDELRKWIERHADEDWGLEVLAKQMNCSVKHVSRQFARRFGEPPLRFKKQILMHRAQILLRTTDISLSEISERLGINDAHYFNRLFRHEFGIAPARYRKQTRTADI